MFFGDSKRFFCEKYDWLILESLFFIQMEQKVQKSSHKITEKSVILKQIVSHHGKPKEYFLKFN